jgi:hypothetical protein
MSVTVTMEESGVVLPSVVLLESVPDDESFGVPPSLPFPPSSLVDPLFGSSLTHAATTAADATSAMLAASVPRAKNLFPKDRSRIT